MRANDFGFENVFSRQVEGLAKKGDILIGISTSGNSQNVINALNKANKMSVITIGLTGNNGGKMKDICDHLITVSTPVAQHVQEAHITIGHILCDVIEDLVVKE